MHLSRRPFYAFILSVFALALSATAFAAPEVKAPTGFLNKTLQQGDTEYRYVVYVPANYDPASKWPAIVFLNGAGECGTDGTKQVAVGLGPAIMLNNEKWPFIVVFPQKPVVAEQWEKYDDQVMAMLSKTMIDYSVDPARLYLTGLSQGGHGTWTIGANHTDLWAAIVPICGYGDAAKFAPALKSTPVWCFHGEADPAVPVAQSKSIVEAIKAAGGSPKLTTYPGVGHNSWDKAYRDEKLYDWLLSNRRSDR